jgi:hypothetical protein
MTIKSGLILLALVFNSKISWAEGKEAPPAPVGCRIVSLEKNPMRYIFNMIKNTPDIYYAQATSYSQEDESFTFKILEVLKGEKRKDFSVLGHPVPEGTVENDFGGHKAQAFWEDVTTARTTFSSDCRLNPEFKIGSKYVIFLKQPYQAKSFEYVKSRSDKWFLHIYETIHPTKKIKKVDAGMTQQGTPATQAAQPAQATPASEPAAAPAQPPASP